MATLCDPVLTSTFHTKPSAESAINISPADLDSSSMPLSSPEPGISEIPAPAPWQQSFLPSRSTVSSSSARFPGSENVVIWLLEDDVEKP
jgi:hypothetical protein